MEHVSTLCAISTVGIAPTGFAFGRVNRSSSRPGRFRKKTLQLHDQCATSTDSNISPPDINAAPTRYFATATADSPVASFPHVCEDDVPQVQLGEVKANRKPSFAAVRLRRRGQTLTGPPRSVFGNSSVASPVRRPSSSWMRRLSFQPEKRSSFQIPASPSSNGPDSPTGPHIQRRPNKLVKRPPSQNVNASSLFENAPSSPNTSRVICRPVTSYQRPEALGHKATHSLNFEPSMAFVPPPKRTDMPTLGDDVVWHPYIGASPEGVSERLARRFSTAAKPKDQGLRRIVPNPDAAPALLLATAISNKHPAGQGCVGESPPASLVQFRNPFGPSVVSQQQPELSLPPHKNDFQTSSSDDAEPRRPVTSTSCADVEQFHNGSLFHTKRRAISTPFPTLTKSTGTLLTSSRAHSRRNITDPTIFRHSPTASQAGVSHPMASELVGPRRKGFASCDQDYKVEMSHLRNIASHAFTSDIIPLSRIQGTSRQRPKRHSIAASDPASTVIGSDDTHIFTSGEEDETEFLSDTAFDSIRTHVTISSNSGPYTSRLQSIFNEDFPSIITEKSPEITTLDHRRSLASHSPGIYNSDSDMDATSISMSIPIADEASGTYKNNSVMSFPSDLTKNKNSRSLPTELPGGDGLPTQTRSLTTSSKDQGDGHGNEVFLFHKPISSHEPRQSIGHDSHCFADETLDSFPKMNIFDWSEQPKNDREASGPDGRPRTVHGKHALDVRGSRAAGRKAPSTLHLRSQSVPVTRDAPAVNEQRQTSGKFGTWGLGSKGVSEDWESDFDFEDADENITSENIKPSKKSVPCRGMIVPQAIMERQASLHGQFGQVQELTLLVEELRRLRHQGSFLNIVRGPSSELWKEAEGIVNLATLDDDDRNHSPPGSPSSLTFSFEESEGDSNTNDPWRRASGGSWGISLSEHSSSRPTTSPSQEAPIKPNSVLDLIYQQRDSGDSTFTDPHLPRPKKLPFDTQSLHDLVVRAGVVTRALKDVIRKAEGVTIEPKETIHLSDPPFSRIFDLCSHNDTSIEASTE
ncbi:hypothetical protein BO70DRAFT_357117 [Aspergillus heteromorphus CBS 117.55]|uniref:Uncharacterized protein n=1 Tax=Aspergillus heteromorphus CBS 117.55 TaxID=1448321 RepID=A0A317USW3_9EURO|nr:uncharacterized protein BO70DRAFT_357117 [Aspergillus heteromorphus CBS 117.55]PWY63552.1 hypothetical protein BO70DRAFT_357117 [Aspergillus heteromorphus CBS 117.55]